MWRVWKLALLATASPDPNFTVSLARTKNFSIRRFSEILDSGYEDVVCYLVTSTACVFLKNQPNFKYVDSNLKHKGFVKLQLSYISCASMTSASVIWELAGIPFTLPQSFWNVSFRFKQIQQLTTTTRFKIVCR